VIDEACFLRDETSAAPDVELYRAVRPSLMTLADSLLVGIWSPWRRSGLLFQKWKQAWGQDGSTLFWKAPSLTMNPTRAAEKIAEASADDPVAARSEWQGEWREDLEAFLTDAMLAAVTVPGRLRLPRVADVTYYGVLDPSGGSQDSFALAIAHAEGDRVILDVVEERKPPFDPSIVTEEYAALLREYGCTTAEADRYAGQWVVEAFGKHGISVAQTAKPKSELYLNFLPLVTTKRCELLDDARLLAQLANLERRVRAGGRDVVDHPPAGRDDRCNAAVGALVAAAQSGETCGPTAINLAPEAHRGVDWDAVRHDPVLGIRGRLRDGF